MAKTVRVKLTKDWIGPSGPDHKAGDTISVDEATAAKLIAEGTATAAPEASGGTEGWIGPS